MKKTKKSKPLTVESQVKQFAKTASKLNEIFYFISDKDEVAAAKLIDCDYIPSPRSRANHYEKVVPTLHRMLRNIANLNG